nr:MAG TPA: adenine-specific methyltransferase [Caudoviricetes sp.]
MDVKLKPIVKWAGGKSKLLKDIKRLLPEDFEDRFYIEPFLGDASVLLGLKPKRAVVSDTNMNLVTLYQMVAMNVHGMMRMLHILSMDQSEEEYYRVRNVFNGSLSPDNRAIGVLYLNHLSYNGLWRENSSGDFNSPYGKRERHPLIDFDNLQHVAGYLSRKDVEIIGGGWDRLKHAMMAYPKTFTYLNPPYLQFDRKGFMEYTRDGWSLKDLIELRDYLRNLKGDVRFMLSLNDCEINRVLFQDCRIETVTTRYSINRNGEGRKPVTELLIMNY